MAEIFYKDKARIFECKVIIEGADIDKSSARLVLKFPNTKVNHLYYGKINEDNICSIEIPPLKEMKDVKGEAILEVIAESTFFESWKGDFEVKQSKSVKVEMVTRDKEQIKEAPKVTVVTSQKTEQKKKPLKEKTTTKQKLLNLFEQSRAKLKAANKKDYFPSFTAVEISESCKIKDSDKLDFQFFLDKKIEERKLKQLETIISKEK